jgi:hypothetical protein
MKYWCYSSDILNEDKPLIYSHKSATYIHDFFLYPSVLQTVRIFDVAADTTTEHQFVLEQIMDTEWQLTNMITSLHDLLALLHKQKHMKGKRKSWSACRNFPMRNNSLKLSNKMADLLPIRINHRQNGFEIIAPHFPHRRLPTIRLALLDSSSNRSLAQTPRITLRPVGAESRLSKGRSAWRKRFPRRNFNLIICHGFHTRYSVYFATLQLLWQYMKNRRTERTKILRS